MGGSNSHVTGSHQKRIWAVTARDGWPQSNQGRMHRHRHAPKQATLAKEFVLSLCLFRRMVFPASRRGYVPLQCLLLLCPHCLQQAYASWWSCNNEKVAIGTDPFQLNTRRKPQHASSPKPPKATAKHHGLLHCTHGPHPANNVRPPLLLELARVVWGMSFAPNHLYIAGPQPAAAFSKPFTTGDTSCANTHWS